MKWKQKSEIENGMYGETYFKRVLELQNPNQHFFFNINIAFPLSPTISAE